MIKGVNKKVIEVNNPENPYFDKVVLYIKPNKDFHTQNELSNEVDRYLKSIEVKKSKPIENPKGVEVLPFILGMAIILMLVVFLALIRL
jgi:hypothetical protein